MICSWFFKALILQDYIVSNVSDWRLYIDSTPRSLKAVQLQLYNDNFKPCIPFDKFKTIIIRQYENII